MAVAESIKDKEEDISYMRMRDIKELIPVSSSTIFNWARKGILTPIKITEGCTVYDRKEVEKLLGVKSQENNQWM